MRWLVAIVFLFWGDVNTRAQGQFEQLLGPQTEAIGQISTTQFSSYSSLNNPSLLSKNKKFSIGVALKNLFLIQALNSGALSLQMPSKIGTFGLFVSGISWEDYTQYFSGFAFGKELGGGFSIGARLKNSTTTFGSQYNSTNLLSSDLGMNIELNEHLVLGVFFLNIASHNFKNKLLSNDFPFTSRLGCAYYFSEKVALFTEIDKSVRHPVSGKLGVTYRLKERFTLSGGYNSSPNSFSFGISFSPSETLGIHFANTLHSILGHSPSLGFEYEKQ